MGQFQHMITRAHGSCTVPELKGIIAHSVKDMKKMTEEKKKMTTVMKRDTN
jgi:hypothetical protein